MAVLKKLEIDENVYEKAKERVREAYRQMDHVAVSFSGGKDSTAVLNITLEVARELDRLPLEVVHWDEEAIHPETVEYLERVESNPDIDFKWYCLPVKHRNACSRKEPWWYCWDPDKKDLWVRDLPKNAITECPKFKKGMTVPEHARKMYPEDKGKVGMILGLRALESMNRYRAVTGRTEYNYISQSSMNSKNYYNVSPVYDWSAKDIWLATAKQEWDYNQTYDVFQRCGVEMEKARVCPPFGEEPLRGLWLYAECWPELWHKMVKRVPGVSTAWRYGNTSMYGVFLKTPPYGMTWQEYLPLCIALNGKKEQKILYKSINQCIRLHNNKSRSKIPEDAPCPNSGISWKLLCQMAMKGDLKGRTKSKRMFDPKVAKEFNSSYLDYKKGSV